MPYVSVNIDVDVYVSDEQIMQNLDSNDVNSVMQSLQGQQGNDQGGHTRYLMEVVSEIIKYSNNHLALANELQAKYLNQNEEGTAR